MLCQRLDKDLVKTSLPGDDIWEAETNHVGLCHLSAMGETT